MLRTVAALACLVVVAPAARAEVAPAPPPAAPARASPAPPAAEPGPQPGQEVVVLLKDGQRLKGRLVSQDASGVVIETSGARMQLPAASIQALAIPGSDAAEGAWPGDPNRTRYLYSPTGFMLRAGEGYLSQSELIVTTAMYGVTDHLTLGIGSSIPFWFGGYVPLVATVKAGGSPAEWLHLAGGAQVATVLGADETFAVGLLFATVTLGSEDLNLGVSGGRPWAATSGDTEVGSWVFSVSGNWRVGRSIALVTENWLVPVDGKTEVVDSLAVRFIGERLAVDAGFIFKIGEPYPIPWLDFTWHWGTPRSRAK